MAAEPTQHIWQDHVQRGLRRRRASASRLFNGPVFQIQFGNPHVQTFDLFEGSQVDFTQKFNDLGSVASMKALWPSPPFGVRNVQPCLRSDPGLAVRHAKVSSIYFGPIRPRHLGASIRYSLLLPFRRWP